MNPYIAKLFASRLSTALNKHGIGIDEEKVIKSFMNIKTKEYSLWLAECKKAVKPHAYLKDASLRTSL